MATSLNLTKKNPENTPVGEIKATERHVAGYACKGSKPTGALVNYFMTFMTDNQVENSRANAKS